MNWWLLRSSRAQSEKTAIGELVVASDWLSDVRWSFAGDLRLLVSFTIHYASTSAALVMEYPTLFPDLPPQIKPAENELLSGHQYGAGGELCLEWRTDNWHPDVTGAMMIESAYRLLSGEAPIEGERQVVPSAHRASVGQNVRASSMRIVLPHEMKMALDEVAPGTIYPLRIAELRRADRWIAHVEHVGVEDGTATSKRLPPEWIRRKGSYLRLPDRAAIPSDLEQLVEAIRAAGDNSLAEQIETGSSEHPVLLSNGAKATLRTAITFSDERKVLPYTTVSAPPCQQRLPDVTSLASSRIGIVGCGSVGSKVALSLARSGAANFVLVDGDVYFENNLVRNALDYRAVGLHKTDAVEAAIAEINPQAAVTNLRVGLGAQESSVFMESAITALGNCDLLIDATGDAAGFNILGGIAQRSNTPLVFGEVYGGGIGGLVCRLRPGLEPTPFVARDQIEAWCEETGIPPPKPSDAGYAASDVEGTPLIADDTAVSVIAAHFAAMAMDALAKPDDSRFPFPAYMIGLRQGWIFSAPFETFPIDLHQQGTWGPTTDGGGTGGIKSFFEEVIADMREPENGADEA